MDESLDELVYGVLDAATPEEEHVPVHHIALQGTPDEAITYRLMVINQTADESGGSLVEIGIFEVTLWMREYNPDLPKTVRKAIRDAGMKTSQDEQDHRTINGVEYFTYSMAVTAWRRMKDD